MPKVTKRTSEIRNRASQNERLVKLHSFYYRTLDYAKIAAKEKYKSGFIFLEKDGSRFIVCSPLAARYYIANNYTRVA